MQSDRESIPVWQEAQWNLSDFSEIMHHAEIPFCLVAGTLLGAYREDDFLKGDEDDIDVAVPAEDFERIDTVKAALEQKGFQNHKRFVVKGVLEAIGYKRGKNHLDISAMHIRGDKAFCYGRSFNKHGLPPIFVYVFPAKCFEQFEETTLNGIDCAIPAHTEDYLSAKYIDWKTPTDRQSYDYLDVKQSPCVDGSGWWDND